MIKKKAWHSVYSVVHILARLADGGGVLWPMAMSVAPFDLDFTLMCLVLCNGYSGYS
jgi:hypothetical protein